MGGGQKLNRAFELKNFNIDKNIVISNKHSLKHPHIFLYRYYMAFSQRLYKIFQKMAYLIRFVFGLMWHRFYFIEPKTQSAYEDFIRNIHSGTFRLRDNTYIIHSYFAHNFFADSKHIELRQDFKLNKPLSSANAALKDKILGTLDSVFLHIRRGDYLESKHWHFRQLGSTYYNNAICELKRHIKKPHIFVFSNDMAWCKQNLIKSLDRDVCENVEFEFIEGNSELDCVQEMELMRSCQNAIITNSTFSWWAAYLIENPSKIVCMPKFWFYDPRYMTTKNLQCKGWIALDDIWRN